MNRLSNNIHVRSRHGVLPFAVASMLALACAVYSAGPAMGVPPRAHASHALRAADRADLRYVQAKSEGSYLFEEGSAAGTLPGFMRANCDIQATFTATFTIYTRSGEIKGHALAIMHGAGRYESFAGTMTATGGSNRYVHAHGHGGFYGVLDRRTYAMTIQTTGSLAY
jgi:hypothetical protein